MASHVGEEVNEDALEECRIGHDRRKSLGQRCGDRWQFIGQESPIENFLEVGRLTLHGESPRFDPAEIEEVGDNVIETLSRTSDSLFQFASFTRRERPGRIIEGFGG